jgi:hypothetical protein
MTEDIRQEVVTTSLKQLHLNRMARDGESAAREAEQRGLGYLGYLQGLLEGERAQRQEQPLRQRLKAAAFPYQKRLEDFAFSLVPCISKVRLLELAQGAFLDSHDNVLLITHATGRAHPRSTTLTGSTLTRSPRGRASQASASVFSPCQLRSIPASTFPQQACISPSRRFLPGVAPASSEHARRRCRTRPPTAVLTRIEPYPSQ